MQGTEQLSEFEKESVKWYNEIRQGASFRSLPQVVIPAVCAIGTVKPSLIIESVNLRSSSKYVGNLDVLIAKSSVMGLENLAKTVPDIATYLKNEKIDYFTELLKRRFQNGTSWQDYCKILQDLITSLGQENQLSSTIPKERFIPPSAPYSAIALLRKIVKIAKINLKVIDPYADIDTVSLIENCDVGVNIQILSTQASKNRGISSLIHEDKRIKRNMDI